MKKKFWVGTKNLRSVGEPETQHFFSWPYHKIPNWCFTDFLRYYSALDSVKLEANKGDMSYFYKQEEVNNLWYEPQHDKTNRMICPPSEMRISLGICPFWPESSLSTWRNHRSLATHWAYSEDSGWSESSLPRLIWVFTGHTGHYAGFVMRQLSIISLVWLL